MDAHPPLLFWDVDTQVDFVQEDGRLYVEGAEEIVPQLARLTEAARDLGLPVVASADEHVPEDEELSRDPDFEETYPPHCMKGTPGQEKIPETRREDLVEIGKEPIPSPVLEWKVRGAPGLLLLKDRFDVFSNPNTETVLELLDPERVVLYGVALDVCVSHALEGLWQRGYRRLTLVRDATAAIRDEKGGELFERWRERGVELVTTDELLERLGRAGEPQERAPEAHRLATA